MLRREKGERQAPAASWRTRGAIALKAAVTLAVLAAVVRNADWHGIAHGIAQASPVRLGLAFAAALLIPIFGGLRWWAVLRGLGETARPGLLSTWFSVGMAVGQVLPMVAGDGVRLWLATRSAYRLRPATHSVVLERILMLLALLTLGALTQPLLAERLGSAAPRWVAALLLLAASGGFALLLLADRVANWLGMRRFAQPLAALSADTRRCLLSSWGPTAFLLALLSNLHFAIVVALLANALRLPASFSDFLAFMPLVTIATTLPISLGGWGVREGVLVALLGAVGVPAAQAFALSITFGAFGTLAGFPGLLAWWLRRGPGSPADAAAPGPPRITASPPIAAPLGGQAV